jgi:hypothetical protein
MSDEAYFTNWALGSDFEGRDHFHDVALHEARVASDARGRHFTAPASRGLVERLRAALTRAVPAERCDCPVAA